MGLGGLRRGRFTRLGTLPSHRGHPARTGTLPSRRVRSARAGTGILSPTASNAPGRDGTHPAAQDVPRRRRTPPAVWNCPRRRGTSLWTVPPQIEDVLFGRGLRSPSEGDGSGAVVWGRSTSWAQNAVLDGPGRSCGALVETGQSRTRACRSTLPMWGVSHPTGRAWREAPSSRLVRAGRHNLVVVFTASTGTRRPRWARPPVSGCSGIGFAPWLQDDASTPTPALRPCACGPRSRARQTTNLPELGAEPAPTPPVPPTGPPDAG